jgi:hypothetical protein
MSLPNEHHSVRVFQVWARLMYKPSINKTVSQIQKLAPRPVGMYIMPHRPSLYVSRCTYKDLIGGSWKS